MLARITESGNKVWLNRYLGEPAAYTVELPLAGDRWQMVFIVGQQGLAFFIGKVDADATTAATEVQFDFTLSVGIVLSSSNPVFGGIGCP